MIRIVLKKMLKNKWLVFCLLFGGLLAVCIISSIPMYSEATMQRMVRKDLENIQNEEHVYPGRFYFSWSGLATNVEGDELKQAYVDCRQKIEEELLPELGVPVQSANLLRNANAFRISREEEYSSSMRTQASFASILHLDEHIELVSGSLPSAEKTADGAFEVIVTEEAAKNLGVGVDGVYYMHNYTELIAQPMKVKVVGVFQNKEGDNLFWQDGMDQYSSSLFLNEQLFDAALLNGPVSLINKAEWLYALDYETIRVEQIPHILGSISAAVQTLDQNMRINLAAQEALENYSERSGQLTYTLWTLQVPVLLMIAFYIFMVSTLIVNFERNEIAVMQSRGATKKQVLGIYTYQALFLAVLSVLFGPLVGRLICGMLGSTNGFMEFVNRTSMEIRLSFDAYFYALCAVVVFCATMLLPIAFSSDTSVVEYKRKKNRRKNSVLWKKCGLDYILLLVSGYGYYTYRNRTLVLLNTNISAKEIPIDPLLFVISVLFILGCGLLFLRLYPYLLRFLFWAGKRVWRPVLYVGLSGVCRMSTREYFIILFLILTTSLGVYNAVSARTVNQNDEDRICYEIGADIVVKENWKGEDENGTPEYLLTQDGILPAGIELFYTEPQFSRFENLEGIEQAARVFTDNHASVLVGGVRSDPLQLMGVDPIQFAQVAWTRQDMLDHHINEYMNLLALNPQACYVSNSLMKKMGCSPGDSILVEMGGEYMECQIFAGIDFFPTYNPYQSEYEGKRKELVVVNLDYLHQNLKLEPYSVWMKKADGVTSEQIYSQLQEGDFELLSVRDASQELIKLKNDPLLQGTNGSLTLSFLITILVTMVGYTIYWIISIKGRLLQFGILRSMGLSKLGLMLMLGCEQFFLSIVPMLIGIGIGTGSAVLFVPLLQMNSDMESQVPPFVSVMMAQDYWMLTGIFVAMILIGTVILSYIVSKINVNQVLKLGED